MKLSKLTFAVATALTASVTTSAFAMDLYVDTKTKQIYAEPGVGRQKLGTFEQVVPHKGVDDFSDKVHQLEAHVENDLALQRNEIKALEEKAEAFSGAPKVSMDSKGLQVQSADKNYKFKIGGRIHADANFHDGDTQAIGNPNAPTLTDANDGTHIRRARMRLEGVFHKDWAFRTEADFANDKIQVKDAYITWLGSKLVNVTVGQQKQNFSRELQESSNDMMFTERSLMNVFNGDTVDRALGLNFEHFGKNYVAKLGVFGNSIGDSRADTVGAKAKHTDEGWGISSRVTYAPIMEKTKLIHLGVAGNYRVPDDNGDISESKAPAFGYKTTDMSSMKVIDTGAMANISDISMLGLEGAAIYGPFSVGGEYTRAWVNRKGAESGLEFDGWYADAAWTITGESRTYKNGNLTYLKPKKEFNLSKGGWGAWELAARYSGADVQDKNVYGGEMQNFTAALNWYMNSNVRLLANYTRNMDIHANSAAANAIPMDDFDVYTIRAQIAY